MCLLRLLQEDDEGEDLGIVDDAEEVEAAQAEQAGRLHARMEQERAQGNTMTDEQLEAYVRERCVQTQWASSWRTRAVCVETAACVPASRRADQRLPH